MAHLFYACLAPPIVVGVLLTCQSLDQGSSNLILEGRCTAEFRSNLPQHTCLEVSSIPSKTLISCFRCLIRVGAKLCRDTGPPGPNLVTPGLDPEYKTCFFTCTCFIHVFSHVFPRKKHRLIFGQYSILKCIYFCDAALYFQHHYCSLQCHMIFRNHSNILICCSRNIYDYYQC